MRKNLFRILKLSFASVLPFAASGCSGGNTWIVQPPAVTDHDTASVAPPVVSKQSLAFAALTSSALAKKVSPAARRLLSLDLREKENASHLASATASPADLEADLSRLNRSYRELRLEFESQQYPQELRNDAVRIGAAAFAAIPNLGMVARVGTAVGAAILNQSLQESLAKFDRQASAYSDQVLGRKLAELTTETWKEWDALAQLGANEARQRALKLVDQWSDTFVTGERDGDRARLRALFNGYLVRAVVGQVAHDGSLRELAERQRTADLDRGVRDLKAIVKTMSAFDGEMVGSLEQLQITQSTLNKAFQEMSITLQAVAENSKAGQEQIAYLERNSAFLNTYLFSKMTPEDQLAALQNGFDPGMADWQRRELERNIQLVARRQEFERIAADVLNGGQVLVRLGTHFGVDPELLGDVQSTINHLGAANEIVSSLASGNFVGALSSVADLLGLGGPDVAAERHQELLSGLSALAQGQQVILEMQGELLRQQKHTLDVQRLLFGMLQEVAVKISETHRMVSERLDHLSGDVLYNRAMIRQVLTKQVTKCSTFLESRTAHPDFYVVLGHFTSFGGMAKHFRDNSRKFFDCADGLEELFTTPGPVQMALHLRADAYRDAGATAFVEGTYLPAARFTLSQIPVAESLALRLEIPARSSDQFEAKLGLLKPNGETARKENPFSHERLIDPLNVDALGEYVDKLLLIYPYLDLLDTRSGQNLIGMADLVEGQPFGQREKIRYRLEGALALAKLGVAQESIVAGEPVLPNLYDAFVTPGTESVNCEARTDHPVCLVQGNGLLRKNFLLYSIRRSLRENYDNSITYAVALQEQHRPYLLERFLPKGWKLEAVPKGWAVRFGEMLAPLPSAAEVMADELTYRPDLQRYLAIKEKIITHLMDLEVEQRMETPTERSFFSRMILQ